MLQDRVFGFPIIKQKIPEKILRDSLCVFLCLSR